MDDPLHLVSVFLGWMLINCIGTTTLIKYNSLRSRNVQGNFKLLLMEKYSIISLIIEVVASCLMIISFFIPWYYHLLGVISGGYCLQYLYFIEADNTLTIFTVLIYYAYFISLMIIFIKISTRKNFSLLQIFELIEIIFFIPGIIIIFNINYGPIATFSIMYHIESNWTSGFILFIISIAILKSNGLQISLYARITQGKK